MYSTELYNISYCNLEPVFSLEIKKFVTIVQCTLVYMHVVQLLVQYSCTIYATLYSTYVTTTYVRAA